MSIPKPQVPLADNICSVINDHTLYVYSANGFQSLQLKQGAKWKKLSSGESVQGGTCVGVPGDSLWIVGGHSSTEGYMGLQKFSYSTGEWETIHSQEPVARDRRWHGAAYLKETDQIVTYAGNTDGAQHISTSSFTIRASEPYDTLAYESNDAPPATNPIVLPWSDSAVMMMGGDGEDRKKITLFNPELGWHNSEISLADPLKDKAVVQAIIVDGDDGSKNLLTFDMSESPNKVERTVLVGADGQKVSNAQVVGAQRKARDTTDAGPVRRDLTVENWPTYNDTLAPELTRANFALAEGDGTVVMVGGNDQSVLDMFDVGRNSWQNATLALADEQEVLALSTSSTESSVSSSATSSEIPSSTSDVTSSAETSSSASVSASSTVSDAVGALTSASEAPSASESADAAPVANTSDGDSLSINAVLGIVLGSIVFVVLLLGLILFCIRRKRLQRRELEENHNKLAREASSRRQAEKGVHSEFEKELTMGDPGPHPTFKGQFKGHQASDSAGSYSSMAILMGQMNQQKPGQTDAPSGVKDFSARSPKSHKLGEISRPIPQEPSPTIRNDGRPLTGDEKNVSFAANTGGQPRAAPPPGMAQGADGTRRSSGWNRYWSGGSALNILGYGDKKRMTQDSDQSSQYSAQPPNRVTQDSATVPPLTYEGRPQMNSVASGSPTVAQPQNSNLRINQEQSGKIERPTSAATSGYSSGIPESVRDTWDPSVAGKPWGEQRAPSSVYTESFYHPTSLAPSSRPTPPNVPDGVSRQPPLPQASTSGDMSWLNLGEVNKNGQR